MFSKLGMKFLGRLPCCRPCLVLREIADAIIANYSRAVID
jgi:hypothetical protein